MLRKKSMLATLKTHGGSMAENMVRMSLELSPDVNQTLDRLAERMHTSKSEVLRKAIGLIEVAVEAREQGKEFGIAEKGTPLQTRIIGL
jgi:predicted transcriptional regulator